MYVLLIIVLTTAGFALLVGGIQKQRWWQVVAGATALLATWLFFALLSFWAEMLWFDALGYSSRFWTVMWAKLGLALGGAIAGGLGLYLLTWLIPRQSAIGRVWPETLGALLGAAWGLASWDVVLKFWYRVSTDVRDPILGYDVGFYLFSLPFYDHLYWLLLTMTALSLIAAIMSCVVPRQTSEVSVSSLQQAIVEIGTQKDRDWTDHRALFFALGALGLVLAWGKYLDTFHLLYSQWGVVTGPGWTDVKLRLPAYYVVAVITALFSLDLMAPAASRKVYHWFRQWRVGGEGSAWFALGLPAAVVAATWLMGLVLLPAVVQWIMVEPNEITVEEPYIRHNIQFTRAGFRLDQVEQREFPVSGDLTRQTIDNNQHLLSEVRLWDPRALDAVYKQFQEIRLYYEFLDVDVDRYTIDGRRRQVMVSVRELELDNLPKQSQTFVNRCFKYTHGHGLVLAPVSDFTPEGLPNLLVKDIPPRSDSADLQVEQPQVYFGERTTEHAVVNTKEEEFDYPSGDQNVYCRYSGKGGVALSNLWRKFVFGWQFDGTRFFFSSYPTRQSRIMFRRQIRERVEALAPFLQFDDDAYVVLSEGKISWVIDGYTTSRFYPYSTHLHSEEVAESVRGCNYVRNSVKAVVDAFDGSVALYVFEPDDPLIQVWSRIFPRLFQSRDDMPAGLRSHVRYPQQLLLAQGLVYARYHMTDPAVFYNQEDLWIRATEKYYAKLQPVEPYYVMWKPPGSKEAEFVLILPFTPKNKQVMIGWIAGMCDDPNYGRLLAYRFPKEKRVLGPQQVETKIDQDRFLSGQLTLWDQRGSQVIRGNLLVIPVDGTLLYVEPIYLQADAAAFPEIRLVAVMHGDTLSYANTLDEALRGLYENGASRLAAERVEAVGQQPLEQLIQQANQAFDSYLSLQGQKRFDEAARELTRLEDALRALQQRTQAAGND